MTSHTPAASRSPHPAGGAEGKPASPPRALWGRRHLLSAADLSRDDALLLLDTAEILDPKQRRGPSAAQRLQTLPGSTVVNLFFEDCPRTRLSFETAARQLGAAVIHFPTQGASASTGRSLKDTALALESLGADAVVVRHPASGAAQSLARSVHGSVVNAGDGTHEHPTQALGDALTIRRRLGAVAGRQITIVGDVAHSHVARSSVLLLHTLGADVTLVAPPALLPPAVDAWPCRLSWDLDPQLAGCDAVIMLPVPAGHLASTRFPAAGEYLRRYRLDRRRLELMPSHAILLHPGPRGDGRQITVEAAISRRSAMTEQAACAEACRMAVLSVLLGGHVPTNGRSKDRPEPGRRQQDVPALLDFARAPSAP